MMDLRSKRILVTGGSGFLGSHIMDLLRQMGCVQVAAPRRRQFDLVRQEAVERLFEEYRPEVVIHCAATVGGIGANRDNPGRFFYENAMMGIQLIEACRRYEVVKTVVLGTICAYPKFAAVPFREPSLWDGYPEETNAPYGIAKKALLVQCQAYRAQYGTNAVFLLPVNLYGPRDNFDLHSSHVIPAIIRKCVEAIKNTSGTITLWGDGSPTREFLYVEDAARGVMLAGERYDKPDPVNLGSSEEISIRDLVTLIAELTDFEGEIVFDATKPDGQPRRKLNVERAKREFGFMSETPFRVGLKQTIDWIKAATTMPSAA